MPSIRILLAAVLVSLACGVANAKDRWIYVSKFPLDENVDPVGEAPKALAWFALNAAYDPAYQVTGFAGAPIHPGKRLQKISGSEIREFWEKGDTIKVGTVYVAEACKETAEGVVIKETRRKSAIEAGLASLLAAILDGKFKGAEGGASPLRICIAVDSLDLTEERALVAMAHKMDKKDDKAKADAELVLITGSKEHLFLSGDIVTQGAKQLKFDRATSTVTEKDNPTTIYLGINYMIGDVYARGTDKLSFDRVVIRGQLELSRDPLNTVGVGLGYRIHDFGDPKANSGIVFFVSSLWAKPDKTDGGGDLKRKQSWRVGIAYGLDKALGWVK